MRYKPRLTDKALLGMQAALSYVFAGEALDGDLYEDRQAVRSATRWVQRMLAYREAEAAARAASKQVPS